MASDADSDDRFNRHDHLESGGSFHNQSEVLTQDSLVRHHAECKLDNKLRLKQVKNLDELIHFRIKTANHMADEDGDGFLHSETLKNNGLLGLRQMLDPVGFMDRKKNADLATVDAPADDEKSHGGDSLMHENLLQDNQSEKTIAIEGA